MARPDVGLQVPERRHRPWVAGLLGLLLVWSSVPSTSAAATPPTPPGPNDRLGYYHPVSPFRVRDTRSGAPIGSNGSIAVDVTGSGGVPASGAAAIVVNVTAIKPTKSTYLTVYPSGESRPTASNLNVTAGRTVANLVVAKIGADGRIRIYNATGSTHVVVDIAGWYDNILRAYPDAPDPSGARFSPVTPFRALDTRTAGAKTPMGPGTTRTLGIAGVGGLPATGVTAVALNVTAVKPTKSTYLTVYPSGESRPLASNVNAPAGSIVPNLVVAKVGVDGKIRIYNSSGSTHVVVDVAGWYGTHGSGDLFGSFDGTLAGGEFTANSPVRVLDTRASGPVGPGQKVTIDLAGRGYLPPAGLGGVVLNVTGVAPTKATYLTVYPTGAARPLASNLNLRAGTTVANLVFAKVSASGKVDIYNEAGSTHVVADIAGWFLRRGATPETPFDGGGGLAAAGVTIPQRAAPDAASVTGARFENPLTADQGRSLWAGGHLDAVIAAARPMPVRPRAGSAPQDRGADRAPGGRDTAAVDDGSELWLHSHRYFDEGHQYPQVGRLFLRIPVSHTDYRGRSVPAGYSVCSGTLVARNLVLTAAHCVVSRSMSGTDVWFDQFAFVPGQYADARPHGVWTDWTQVDTPGSALGSPWFTTLTNEEDGLTGDFYPTDYAFVSFAEVDGAYPGDVAGFLPIAQSWATWIQDVGYPADGGFSDYCGGGPGTDSCYPFATWTTFGGAFDHGDGPLPDPGGWFEVGVGSWMTGGSSGGPMLATFDGEAYVSSVNSNGLGYSQDGESWGFNMWGPWFNDYTFELYDGLALP